MALTYLEIVGIVSRGHLHTASAELRVHKIVSNNGNFPVSQRQHHRFPNEVFKSFITRMNRNGGISQHGFRTGGGNRYRIITV